MSDNIHEKLGRVRKPRVHITYDVETSGDQQLRELPFVVGVLGDYSGDNSAARKPLKERKFINVDRDNFNETMTKIAPSLSFRVDDVISAETGKQFDVNLEFRSLEDFEPENIVRQIAPLNALLDARNKLRDLMTKVDRSEQLETLLEQVLQNTDELAALAQQLESDMEV
jgi:type VI secretion system protein ImpB